MNVNMKLSKEELNGVFETLLKTAISNNIILNFNIDLESMATPVVTYTEVDVKEEDELQEPTRVQLGDTPTTFSRCLECGCVQVVNTSREIPYCYVCGDELPTDKRPYEGECLGCGEELRVDILGTGVDYVSCHKCRKRHTIKLDFTQTKWINKW